MQTHSTDLLTDTEIQIGWYGVAIAFLIMIVWATSLIFLLSIKVEAFGFLETVFAVCFQTFLYTGLFITAHDAMHQVVCPSHPKLNHIIGKASLFLYAFLPYQQLLKQHWYHHLYPASHKDPDFHDGRNVSLLSWYARFMLRYWGWGNSIAVTVCYHSMHHLLHISHANLVLFWVFPSILSSFQLFYFGTFLPHREPSEGYANIFRSRSIYRPFWLSLLTCYHFGYHYEHHQYPELPWWMLPAIASRHNENQLNFGAKNDLD